MPPKKRNQQNSKPKPKWEPKALAARRERAGLTQKQLADKLGVDSMTVSRWERGETRPLPIMTRALKAVFPGD